MNKVNVVFCGYRNWAINIFNALEENSNIKVKKLITTIEEYKTFETEPIEDVDLILFIGWSWIIPESITENNICLGIHPSDLPNFRGGSPLQNQIMNGLTESKISLITLSSKLDGGHIWMQEHYSLSGDSMSEIFDNIEKSTVKLLNAFFNIYPNIQPKVQNLKLGSYFKRRTPEESKISEENFKNMTLKELYNFIRCLTDPYPNAFIEDAEGNKLVIKNVSFIPSSK